jgi:hypothetical protein
MDYQTPADIVGREQARLRAAIRWVLPAFGLGLVGLGIAFVGHGTGSRLLGLIGFGAGAVGVLLGIVTVARASWVILAGVLRRE